MGQYWLTKDALRAQVRHVIRPARVVLDIGCGIRPQTWVRPSVHICCEPHGEYVDHLRQRVEQESDPTYIILQCRWQEVIALFPPRSVDVVFLVDVIEHLDKEEARQLVSATERIVRSQFAVFTPLGYIKQDHADGTDAWGMHGGAWQTHRSGWLPEDFDDSWDVFAAKAYHFTDNVGRPLDPPHGAFWAIKTLPDSGIPKTPLSNRQRAHLWLDTLFFGVGRTPLYRKLRGQEKPR